MAVDAGTGIEALYRDNSGEWHAIRFRYQGQQYAGWVTATHPEWIRFANAQGQACDLEVHPDYRPTPTPTATPTPTSTSTPTATPAPLPGGDVLPEAMPLYRRAHQFGLPRPFTRWPIQTADGNGLIGIQGYGPSSYAAPKGSGQGPYGATLGLHPGLDFFNSSSNRIANVYNLCDGIIVSGRRREGSGGSAEPGFGLSVLCFAPTGTDPDGDGLLNLSNVVVTYNHLATRLYNPPGDNDTTLQVLLAGTHIGTIDARLPVDRHHLHLEVFINGQKEQSPLHSFRDGIGSIRINPILMFERTLAKLIQSRTIMGAQPASNIPYYPMVYNSVQGKYINNENEPNTRVTYGIDEGEIQAATVHGQLSFTTRNSFWQAQVNTQDGLEWPHIHDQSFSTNTAFASRGNSPLAIATYLQTLYPGGFYTTSERVSCTNLQVGTPLDLTTRCAYSRPQP